MSVTAPAAQAAVDHSTPNRTSTGDVDNLGTYVSFGLAYLLGHGSAALSQGDAPVLDLPGWLPMTLLGAGLAAGTVQATRAALRTQRTTTDPDAVRTAQLLGALWVTAFAALFLAITGLSATVDHPDIQTLLWPTGSGFVVGLIYVAEGAVRRNLLHYALGTWLALTSTTALFLGNPGFYWVLTLAGGGAYALATVLERRRPRRR
ncbi:MULTISPECIES: ABC transporter permease [Streptomyces]|uniref:ABC transporter permease n=1 Tax=Streptomyces glycanivorans TaxID=3033808 RepID=A0ABY9JLS1_9ACTN|nr:MULTISPECIES: ABC transporter permease [unclassified Streptomyces]WLQ68643.1 ABC transporter permease [Streptomyces sp. Alt3]WSQ82000.1 ABC transporter permease [Streptomyces sp. NBC_01213]WSQ89327.1 ABC transporter permease [Streptomyces sp. NBC_01212]WSR52719.1 ABC transporter permease [Streptomyces sp. NBC_01201]